MNEDKKGKMDSGEFENMKERLQNGVDKIDDRRSHHHHRHHHRHHHSPSDKSESGIASSSSHRSSSHRHSSHRHSSHRHSSQGSKSHSSRHHSHSHHSHSHHSDSPSNNDEIKEEYKEEYKEENREFPGYKVSEAPDFSDEEEEEHEFTNESNENLLNRTRDGKGDLNFNILESFYKPEQTQITATTNNNNNKRKGKFELDVQPNDFNQGKTDSKSDNSSKKSCLDIKYEFGDRGSSWRMMKLNKTFEDARENNLDIEESALNKYSSLKEFYIALEEEEEIKRRRVLRLPQDKFKLKPIGSIILAKGLKIEDDEQEDQNANDQQTERKEFNEFLKSQFTDKITSEQVNNAKIEMMKSKLKKSNDFKELESIYNTLKLKFELQNDINNEKSITNEQFNEIYLKNQILNDKLFDNKDLNNQDDNLNNLSNLINDPNSINLQDLIEDNNMSELKKFNDSISNCFFCKLLHNDSNPIILKKFNHFYLINSKQPEITTTNGLMIVPKLHISNSLKLDNEQYTELQGIFKSLKIFYFKKFNKKILIIENSIYKQNHFKINIVPISLKFSKFEIFNYFKIGIIEQIKNEFDISNKLIIDTLNYNTNSGNSNIDSLKVLIPKEAPFFHCIIEFGKGGIGTIVEDVKNWPKDELFYRRIIGGFLNVDKFKIESRTKNINSKDSTVFKNLKIKIDEFFSEL